MKAQQEAENAAREQAAFWAGINAALAFQEAERKARQEAEFWAGVNAALAFQEADRQRAAQQAAQNDANKVAADRARNGAAQVAADRGRNQSAQVAADRGRNQAAIQAADSAHPAGVSAAVKPADHSERRRQTQGDGRPRSRRQFDLLETVHAGVAPVKLREVPVVITLRTVWPPT